MLNNLFLAAYGSKNLLSRQLLIFNDASEFSAQWNYAQVYIFSCKFLNLH